jgi:integrase
MRYKNPNNNKKRNYKLGSYPEMTVKKAREEAKKVYAKVMGAETEDVQQNRRDRIEEGTLAEYSEAYCSSLIDKKSRKYEQYMHTKYIVPGIGDMKLFDIKKADIESLRNKYEDKKHTANRIKIYCVKFFKWCIENGHMKANPASGVEGFREEPKEVEWTPTDIKGVQKALEKYSEDPELEISVIFVSLLFLTLRRQKELLELTWKQIDFKAKLMLKVKIKRWESIGKRDFEIDTPALAQLKRLKTLTGDTKFLFPSEKLSGQPRGYFKNFWAKIREEAGITQSMHDIRHYGTRAMKEMGVDNDTMAYILGHKDATMLSRVYGKSDSRARINALKASRARLMIQ